MTRVLLTGMSGTGKSTLVAELARRGHQAVDLDDPAWSVYGHLDTAPSASGQAGSERREPPEWLWREDRVATLLENAHTLFVAGCAANQGRLYPHLDLVVLLTAPVPVMVQRLESRTDNPFGKHPDELAKVLADTEAIVPILRRGADHEIDTDAPLDEVVARVLEVAGL